MLGMLATWLPQMFLHIAKMFMRVPRMFMHMPKMFVYVPKMFMHMSKMLLLERKLFMLVIVSGGWVYVLVQLKGNSFYSLPKLMDLQRCAVAWTV